MAPKNAKATAPAAAAQTKPISETAQSKSNQQGAAPSGSFVSQQTALVNRLVKSYLESTPQLLRLIDAYLAAVMLSGVIQFVYCVLVGTFPYNSFLSGFIASVGTFVLAANLRMQLNPSNDFQSLSPEAAYAEFAFCSLIFYGFVVNFLG